MLLHQPCRTTAVAPLERFDDLDVLGLRVLGRVPALVHQRDQLRARKQIGDQFGQHLVAQQARQHHMEIGQQPRAATDVAALDGALLFAQMRPQLGQLRVGDARGKFAHHAALDQAAQLEHLAGLFGADGGHESPAGRQQGDEPAAAQLVQRLPHHSARDGEHIGDLLLHQLGARHEALFDDGAGDGLDDLVGAAGRCTRRAHGFHQAQGGGRLSGHGGVR